MSEDTNAYDNISPEELQILSASCDPQHQLSILNRPIIRPPHGMMLADIQAIYASQMGLTEEN